MNLSLVRRFALLGIAASAPLVSAGKAEAALVAFVNLGRPLYTSSEGMYVSLGFNGTLALSNGPVGGWDINIARAGGTVVLSAPSAAENFMRYPGATTGSAGRVPGGTVVNSTRSYGAGAVVFGTGPGEWTVVGNNYFGFRFTVDSATHYGWARIGAALDNLYLMDVVWETTANTPVTVGVVPAPGAVALLGLAGLAGRRRRRR